MSTHDVPAITADRQFIDGTHQPFTVIMMMSDDIRSDESNAADWVRRVWVYGQGGDQGIESMIEEARDKLAALFGWDVSDPYLTQEDIEQRKSALEPVAIYPGHIFDIYQP
ncbi:hypothetical protein [Roseovarius sp. MMSF_3281]|uniref:hypothetical protein n=1 Tax=Roseovarius sp. MMSF_3281 TaxID=3046694 RepID=UPI00273F7017|nr:hypothetical protein [Roseovarius sp. MMSF_3281]